MAVHSTPPYGDAGLDTGQDGMADPTGPSQRRRRDTAAVRLLVSRRWNRAFPRSGVGRAGKAQVRRWRTSATRLVSIRPRPISRRSRFPSCARTVLGAPTACAASSSHSRLPFPQRVRVESKGRAMLLPSMRRVTSCRRSPTPSDEPRRGVTSRDSLWIAQPFCSRATGTASQGVRKAKCSAW
jgi:hypothetical protein